MLLFYIISCGLWTDRKLFEPCLEARQFKILFDSQSENQFNLKQMAGYLISSLEKNIHFNHFFNLSFLFSPLCLFLCRCSRMLRSFCRATRSILRSKLKCLLISFSSPTCPFLTSSWTKVGQKKNHAHSHLLLH